MPIGAYQPGRGADLLRIESKRLQAAGATAFHQGARLSGPPIRTLTRMAQGIDPDAWATATRSGRQLQSAAGDVFWHAR